MKTKNSPSKGHNRKAGADTKTLLEKGRKYYTQNYKPRDIILDHGKGSKLWDLDGNEYIDLGAGIAVCALGYGHPQLIEAVTHQAQKLWHTSNIFFTEPPIKLAENLIKASKFAKRVFFCNSGGEANEAAIKLARKYAANKGNPPESREIVTFTGSFHGRTLATVTATAQPKYHEGFEPLPGGFVYCPFNDLAALEKVVSDKTCAILLELVQGEGGITPVKPEFLARIQELCTQHDALLMIDDVQAGMGRTGKLFSHFNFPGITPDVVTLAKGLGGGIAIGATLIGQKAADTLQFGSHGTTFGGNPLSASVANVVLENLQSKELMDNIKQRSKQLVAGLNKLNKKHALFAEVRGMGLIIGAELQAQWHGKAGEIGDAARAEGVLILQAGPDVLRFVPPLVITESEMTQGLERLGVALEGYLTQHRL